jgi:hypothetical protein
MLLTMCCVLGLVFVLDRRDKKNQIKSTTQHLNERMRFIRSHHAGSCSVIQFKHALDLEEKEQKRRRNDEEMGPKNGMEEYDVASFRSRSIRANYQLQYLVYVL